MTATVTPITAKAKREAASIRMQALLLAQMNEEKAGYCDKQQPGLREFLLMNAALLRKVAES